MQKKEFIVFLQANIAKVADADFTAVVKTEDAGWLCIIGNLFKGIGNELLPSMHGRIGGNGNVQGQ